MSNELPIWACVAIYFGGLAAGLGLGLLIATLTARFIRPPQTTKK